MCSWWLGAQKWQALDGLLGMRKAPYQFHQASCVQLMAGDKGLAKRTLQLVLPFVSLGASLVLGTVAGVAMASCLLWRGPSLQPFARLARRLGPSSGARCSGFSLLLFSPQGPVFSPGSCHGASLHLHTQ